MKRKSFLLLIVLSLYSINSSSVYANGNKEPLENFYPTIGYTSVEKAVKDFEDHFKLDLKLPLRVPPLAFTHQYGRFNDLNGDVNDSLEIDFINEDIPINHYTIHVRPIRHKIHFKDVSAKYIKQTFVLNNGQEAQLITNPSSEVLVFEYNQLQYMLNVNNKVSNKVTPDILVKIANTIE